MTLKKQTIVITGGSDGIGAAAARQLSCGQNNVVLVGRSIAKTALVAEELGVPFHTADFARLDEVRELANAIVDSTRGRIDVLMNNAGAVMTRNRTITGDGNELTFQVNHLAPFLLTSLLMEYLLAAKASVITTASEANYRFGKLDLDDLDSEHQYSPARAYGASKLANILFTRELHRRFNSAGLSAAAVHPGNIASNLTSGSGSLLRFLYKPPLRGLLLTDPTTGAGELARLATTTPGQDWNSGEYYYKGRLGKVHKQAHDPAFAEQLWNKSAARL